MINTLYNDNNNSRIIGRLTSVHQRTIGHLTSKNQRAIGQVKSGMTDNYNKLYNKPMINTVVLEGDKSFEELGLLPLSNADLARILD